MRKLENVHVFICLAHILSRESELWQASRYVAICVRASVPDPLWACCVIVVSAGTQAAWPTR